MTQRKRQLSHLFDSTQCINCGACMVACTATNYTDMLDAPNPGWDWTASNIRRVQWERNGRPQMLLVQCQQCSDAPCVKTCPFGANYYDEDGMVRTDSRKCVGCNYCIASCPYQARWSHPVSGLPMKCMGEGCRKLVQAGEQPACVSACPAHARAFGDVLDPASDISHRIRESRTQKLLETKGCKPNFFVVVQK